MSSTTLSQKQKLEERALALHQRMIAEEEQREQLRHRGRQVLDAADTILQSVEASLEASDGAALTARGRGAPALPPIIRPDSS